MPSPARRRPAGRRTARSASKLPGAVRGKARPSGAGPRGRRPPGQKGPRRGKKKARLRRPTISGDELLDMVFKDDYPSREVFRFLGARTLKDLEAHSAQEILHRLTLPVRNTVELIRARLASFNRFLAGDEQFAADFQLRRNQQE